VTNGKECWKNRSWNNFRYLSQYFPGGGGLRKTTKPLSHDCLSLVRNWTRDLLSTKQEYLSLHHEVRLGRVQCLVLILGTEVEFSASNSRVSMNGVETNTIKIITTECQIKKLLVYSYVKSVIRHKYAGRNNVDENNKICVECSVALFINCLSFYVPTAKICRSVIYHRNVYPMHLYHPNSITH
jgi:hypothetical protein